MSEARRVRNTSKMSEASLFLLTYFYLSKPFKKVAGKNKWHYSCFIVLQESISYILIFSRTFGFNKAFRKTQQRFAHCRKQRKIEFHSQGYSSKNSLTDLLDFLFHCTVFENHRKSLIQHCERSELRLHFEWTKGR